jgi:hypothetical protein
MGSNAVLTFRQTPHGVTAQNNIDKNKPVESLQFLPESFF